MATIYDRARATVVRLLGKYRQGDITLTRVTHGEVDENESWLLPEDTLTVVVLDATVHGVSSQYVNGETILATDLEITASPIGRLQESGSEVEIDPMPGDVVAVGGRAVTVLRQFRIPASGTVAAHKFIVRG